MAEPLRVTIDKKELEEKEKEKKANAANNNNFPTTKIYKDSSSTELAR